MHLLPLHEPGLQPGLTPRKGPYGPSDVRPAYGLLFVVVVVFVNEYLSVGFDEVCRIFDGFTAESASLALEGPLRVLSRRLAVIAVRLPDPSRSGPGRAAEIRIINVESGTPPMTELLLVVPSPVSTGNARFHLQELAKRVEASLSGAPS